MQFRFSNGDPRAKVLANFSWEKSKQFRDAKTGSELLKIWDKLVVPYLKSNGEYKPPTTANATPASTAAATPTSTAAGKRSLEPQSLSTIVTALDPVLPSPKRAKVDEDHDSEASIDAEIEKCFVGKLSEGVGLNAALFIWLCEGWGSIQYYRWWDIIR